jgi:hypothetical protein
MLSVAVGKETAIKILITPEYLGVTEKAMVWHNYGLSAESAV